MQNSHTRKTAYTVFFCILQLIYKENRTELTVFFKTEPKTNGTRGFSENRTELEKYIPRIPSCMPETVMTTTQLRYGKQPCSTEENWWGSRIVSQQGQLSLSSSWGRLMSSKLHQLVL